MSETTNRLFSSSSSWHRLKWSFTEIISTCEIRPQIFGLQINIGYLVKGENSQNFLSKFVRFFVTLGLKILILLRLKVVFKANIIKR